MKVGDLVRMHARSLEPTYGVGIIVKDLRLTGEGRVHVQVHWSRYGLGNMCSVHNLEKIGELKKG